MTEFTIDMTKPGNPARFHLIQIKHALKLYNGTGMIVTRGATPKKLLAMLGQYTNKKYANTAKGRETGIADIESILFDLAIQAYDSIPV